MIAVKAILEGKTVSRDVKEATSNEYRCYSHLGLHHVKPKQDNENKGDNHTPKHIRERMGVVMALAHSNNPTSYEITAEILGLSQTDDGQAIKFRFSGNLAVAVQLETKQSSTREVQSKRKAFLKRAAQDSENFTKSHKVVNVPINSQIIDALDFKQRITRAVPACMGCLTARVIPATPRPQVLTNSSLCVARLIMYHTAQTAIQTGQYFMELV
jgi:hypothetical protein